MLEILLRPLAALPLRCLHVVGAGVGWGAYLLSRRYSTRLDENLRQSGLFPQPEEYRRMRRRAVGEAGKLVTEALAIWLQPRARVLGYLRHVHNEELVDQARAQGRGIVLLTPHLGCFEIAGLYFGEKLPLTVLYRPPRWRSLDRLMARGRGRGHTQLATTDVAGVRRLLLALRKGEAIGLLPDQAPRFGEGAWAPFFGKPAYTMTLSNRLQQATGAAAFMVFAERLPKGRGYDLHIEPLPDRGGDEAALNRAVERAIRMRPEQYLWGYDRFKKPRRAPAPQSGSESALS